MGHEKLNPGGIYDGKVPYLLHYCFGPLYFSTTKILYYNGHKLIFVEEVGPYNCYIYNGHYWIVWLVSDWKWCGLNNFNLVAK